MEIIELANGKLPSLETDGALELVFLGVGSAFTTRNFQANFFLMKGREHVLVDAGEDIKGSLARVGLSPISPRNVIVTHFHGDHAGGINILGLLSMFHPAKPGKPTLILPEDAEQQLWDHVLKGPLHWNARVGEERRLLGLRDYFNVEWPKWKRHQPREAFEIDVGDVKVELFRTNHIPAQATSWEEAAFCVGLFIDDRILISGDTKYDPDLIALYADRAEVIFHDCQLFQPESVHATLDQLKKLPPQWKEKMWLYHYGDDFDSGKHDFSGFAGLAKQGVRYRF